MSDPILDTGEEEQEKPQQTLFDVLNSKIALALISAILGGLATTVINGLFHVKEKEREHAAALMKERSDERRNTQQQFLAAQQIAVQNAFVLAGRVKSGCQGAIDADSELFADEKFAPADRARMKQQRQEFRQEFNDANHEWEQKSANVGFALADYPLESKRVIGAWEAVENTVGDLQDCVYKRVEAKKNKQKLPDCGLSMEKMSHSLNEFRSAARNTRSHAELRWEPSTDAAHLLKANGVKDR